VLSDLVGVDVLQPLRMNFSNPHCDAEFAVVEHVAYAIVIEYLCDATLDFVGLFSHSRLPH
jgi:hypothetical protein